MVFVFLFAFVFDVPVFNTSNIGSQMEMPSYCLPILSTKTHNKWLEKLIISWAPLLLLFFLLHTLNIVLLLLRQMIWFKYFLFNLNLLLLNFLLWGWRLLVIIIGACIVQEAECIRILMHSILLLFKVLIFFDFFDDLLWFRLFFHYFDFNIGIFDFVGFDFVFLLYHNWLFIFRNNFLYTWNFNNLLLLYLTFRYFFYFEDFFNLRYIFELIGGFLSFSPIRFQHFPL